MEFRRDTQGCMFEAGRGGRHLLSKLRYASVHDRRGFLNTLFKACGIVGASVLLPVQGGARTVSKLAVAGGEPETAVKLALDTLGGIDKFVKTGDRVVLKPNASFPAPPHWGSATHPQVLVTVARLCLDAGAKRVVVADNTMRQADLCFRKTGIKDALEVLPDVHILAPKDKKFYRDSQVPQGRALRRTAVMQAVIDADCLINLPTAKSHSATGVSLSLKNLMGLVLDRKTFHRDMDLNQAIADLATIVKPTLNIMDGTYALLTAGPGGPGKVEHWQRVIAGTDPVAVDAYTLGLGTWYGHKVRPNQVKHIKAAHALGLGNIDVKHMEIVERGA